MTLAADAAVYIAPLVAVSFTAGIALMAWIVREMGRITTEVRVIQNASDDLERRIHALERHVG